MGVIKYKNGNWYNISDILWPIGSCYASAFSPVVMMGGTWTSNNTSIYTSKVQFGGASTYTAVIRPSNTNTGGICRSYDNTTANTTFTNGMVVSGYDTRLAAWQALYDKLFYDDDEEGWAFTSATRGTAPSNGLISYYSIWGGSSHNYSGYLFINTGTITATTGKWYIYNWVRTA